MNHWMDRMESWGDRMEKWSDHWQDSELWNFSNPLNYQNIPWSNGSSPR
ncbi:hypothetical protein CCP3SC5AM1_70005 [Gammaproteobacteria bacterium]